MAIEPKRNWMRGWMLALLLIIGGLVLIWQFPDNRIISTAADAILIAGVLALTVDYFLKRDLLTEASRGLFVHMLGFEHHPRVKDKLKEIVFETKLLREEIRETLLVEPCDSGFWVTATYETDIVNPTNNPVSIDPGIEWDVAHKPHLVQMSFTSSDGKVKLSSKDMTLHEKEPGLLTAKLRRIEFRPVSTGVTYRGSGSFKILCRHGYYMVIIGRVPTLKTCIRVEVPDGYEVSAAAPDVRNGNYFEYDSIKMPGDHITVRWRKKDGEWL
ncbi:MAG: hypothetical protein WBV60_05075 [Terriglobales bacterium]